MEILTNLGNGNIESPSNILHLKFLWCYGIYRFYCIFYASCILYFIMKQLCKVTLWCPINFLYWTIVSFGHGIHLYNFTYYDKLRLVGELELVLFCHIHQKQYLCLSVLDILGFIDINRCFFLIFLFSVNFVTSCY